MPRLTRRELLKQTLGAAAACALPSRLIGAVPRHASGAQHGFGSGRSVPSSPRRRVLLDFGWRFALGNAADPAQDFGYGRGNAFAKAGTLFAPSRPDFDDSAWADVDLPHDWAVALPFVNDKQLRDSGYKPLGRTYPATSIGWYRRVIRLAGTEATGAAEPGPSHAPVGLADGRRVALEFDGVFRDAVVASSSRPSSPTTTAGPPPAASHTPCWTRRAARSPRPKPSRPASRRGPASA